MMGWKRVLLVIGVTVAALAYWLYTPLPDGYTYACSQQIQITLAPLKVIELVVGAQLTCLFSSNSFCAAKFPVLHQIC